MKQRVLPPWQLVSCAGSFPCRAAQARAQLSALSCMEQTQAGSESCASQSAIPNGGPRIAARRNKLSNCRISATIAQEILFRQSLREETGAIRRRSQPRKMPSRIRAKPLECVPLLRDALTRKAFLATLCAKPRRQQAAALQKAPRSCRTLTLTWLHPRQSGKSAVS